MKGDFEEAKKNGFRDLRQLWANMIEIERLMLSIPPFKGTPGQILKVKSPKLFDKLLEECGCDCCDHEKDGK